jgi:hypothetical protein
MNPTVTDRIRTLLGDYDISPSHFADEILALRSSISHVLSGRNNPSLELIQKILVKYPEINPGWLLTGKGNMKQLNLFGEEEELLAIPATNSRITDKSPVIKKPVIENISSPAVQPFSSSENEQLDPRETAVPNTTGNKKIEKIMMFYTDKTFSVHFPE